MNITYYTYFNLKAKLIIIEFYFANYLINLSTLLAFYDHNIGKAILSVRYVNNFS